MNELTPEEWRYISILIANDLRTDRQADIPRLVEMHMPIWEKIQPYCRWNDDQEGVA